MSETSQNSSKPCWCRVGGWHVWDVPGTLYTFGCGAFISGPWRVQDVPEEYSGDTAGCEAAVAMSPEAITAEGLPEGGLNQKPKESVWPAPNRCGLCGADLDSTFSCPGCGQATADEDGRPSEIVIFG